MRRLIAIFFSAVVACSALSAQTAKPKIVSERLMKQELDSTRKELRVQKDPALMELKKAPKEDLRTTVPPKEVQPKALTVSHAEPIDSTALKIRTRRQMVEGASAPLQDTMTVEASDSTVERYVYLLHADETRFDQRTNPDAQILVGDVVFRHDSMYM